ncbi:GNAT family N-acetyltransferase [Vibrio sp. S4M6]|uniref:GNAT family N-acetyltransferase n=1 Tax=Vibrio sinus TaxID=2946865 RepID=UPI00202A6E90|nr:GNAT family N-acetyltransferase [Vibrio sinus]MCL9782300.1 GNAT family N-acetyltransferase [Vibrio sinus]
MVLDFQIITPRLVLKLVDSNDSQTLCDCIRQSPSLHQWVDWCSANFSTDEADEFLLNTRLNWVRAQSYGFGVYRKSDNALLGMVSVNELYHTFNMVSLGYWIADRYQHQGLGKESLSAVIEFCFGKLGVTRIEIVCDPDNLPSQKLAIACNAQFEVLAKNRYVYQGVPKAGMVFSIIPGDTC